MSRVNAAVKEEVAQQELTLEDLSKLPLKEVKGRAFALVEGQGCIMNKQLGAGNVPPSVFLVNSLNTHSYGIVRGTFLTEIGIMDTPWYDKNYKVVEIAKTSALFKNLFSRTSVSVIATRLAAAKHHKHIGSDPEIFAVDAKGQLLPAFEFLPSKAKSSFGYWDGYQAECSPQTATCLDIHIGSKIKYCLNYMQAQANNKEGYLVLKNTFDIPAERLQKDDRKFVQFGCTPSLNAYGEEQIKVKGEDVAFRTAGGHLHFTCDRSKAITYVKELDRVLGVISVAMFRYWDTPQRRLYYGRAGEYRLPSHGLEYRVLSNAWLAHPALAHFVYEVSRVLIGQVAGPMENNSSIGKFKEWKVTEEEARTCINDCNVDMAVELLKRNESALTALLLSLPGIRANSSISSPLVSKWKDMIMTGAHAFLKNPDLLSKAWVVGDSGTNMTYTASRLVETGKLD